MKLPCCLLPVLGALFCSNMCLGLSATPSARRTSALQGQCVLGSSHRCAHPGQGHLPALLHLGSCFTNKPSPQRLPGAWESIFCQLEASQQSLHCREVLTAQSSPGHSLRARDADPRSRAGLSLLSPAPAQPSSARGCSRDTLVSQAWWKQPEANLHINSQLVGERDAPLVACQSGDRFKTCGNSISGPDITVAKQATSSPGLWDSLWQHNKRSI